MGIIKFISFLILVLFVSVTIGQERYDVEEVDGEQYYVYIVQQGNTVYGIKTLFKIDENQLIKANPGLSNNLSIGQKILVPVKYSGHKQPGTNANSSATNYKKHKIEKGETFYGLSKKYKVSIEEIKAANPGITELKNGEEINIPVKGGESIQNDGRIENNNNNSNPEVVNIPATNEEETTETSEVEVTWNDSIVKHKVLAHETLYSISRRYMVSVDTIKTINNLRGNRLSTGQELIIPLKSVKIREVLTKDVPKDDTTSVVEYGESEVKGTYNVVMMLPLFLDANAAHLAKGSLTSPRDILSKTKVAVDFYMGVMAAADSMKMAGINLNITVFDTRGDSATTAGFLSKSEMKEADLIIGPFYNNPIGAVAPFAKSNQIHMVVPFSAGNRALFNNPFVSKFVTSNSVLINATADYVMNYYKGKKIVLINSGKKGDKKNYDKMKEMLSDNAVPFTEKSLSMSDMRSYFNKNEVNVVLSPSSDRTFVSNLLVGLNKTLNKFGYKDSTVIELVGLDEWDRYQGIKMKYKTRMNLQYASPIYIDWNSPNAIKVIEKFRQLYETDPSKYGFHGFDIGMKYFSALGLFGNQFHSQLNRVATDGTANRMDFKQVGQTHGYENVGHFFVKYYADYTKNLTK